jgi:hypothetical protein
MCSTVYSSIEALLAHTNTHVCPSEGTVAETAVAALLIKDVIREQVVASTSGASIAVIVLAIVQARIKATEGLPRPGDEITEQPALLRRRTDASKFADAWRAAFGCHGSSI